jgi:phage baseplate assembly protein V
MGVTRTRLMFRVGIVTTQDVPNARVRVTFPDRNQMSSWWLPICVPKSQNDKAYWVPDIGEQVVCMMDEHDEDGAVLGALYSTADQPPAGMTADKWHVTMKDNATFEYDRSSHALAVSLPSGGTVSITANGAAIQIDASGNINLTANGNIHLVTNSHSDSVNNIINTFNEHTHSGVQAGSSNTAAPNQQLS